jgi:hypothetical protein
MSASDEKASPSELVAVKGSVEQEDYEMGIMQQISAASGKLEYIIFGRNEPGLHHFHENYRDALGMPPLDEYRAG